LPHIQVFCLLHLPCVSCEAIRSHISLELVMPTTLQNRFAFVMAGVAAVTSPAAGSADKLPKSGHKYFFSIGDFGVAGCQNGFEQGDLEENGGIGHLACHKNRQEEVAQAMNQWAARLSPEAVISLGDNFYVRGVKDLDDPQIEESFEAVYNKSAMSRLPWRICLGDHDHRGNITALLLHTQRSPRWRLPALYYSFQLLVPGNAGRHIEVVMADSVALEGAMDPELVEKRRFIEDYTDAHVGAEAGHRHWEWLEQTLSSEGPALRIVVAHRPVVSLVHRSRRASELQVEDRLTKLLTNASGISPVIYMHGHDHAMQHWKDLRAPVTHFGNGAGGMGIHPFLPSNYETQRGAEVQWVEQEYGFAIHELGPSDLTTYFVKGETGEVIYAVRTRFGRP